jgi:hypothetical protein
MSKRNLIVIPVYKSIPDWNEKLSFNQCLKILYEHPVCVITYRGLDIFYYMELLTKYEITYRVEYFKRHHFENIAGYNNLLLSSKFYKRFKNLEYILIYQLDAWVFWDELDSWCSRGYDYIGAPWFDGFNKNDLTTKCIGVGNGGFSLRNVKSHLRFTGCPFLWINMNKIFCNFYKGEFSDVLKIVPRIIRRLYNNNLWVIKKKFNCNEDIYWSKIIGDNFDSFKIPKMHEAARFSFEMNPQKLFEETGHELPFGCHAWEKNLNFWNKFILEKL